MKASLLAPPSEAAFTAQVLALAKLRGWKAAHFRSVRVQRKDGSVHYETPVQGEGKGWPDLVMARGRRLIAAELKVGRNEPTAEQAVWLAVLAIAGAEEHVWWPEDWAEIEEVLR